MALEIERKFLITSHTFKKESYKKIYIKQGFLNSDKERTVRIRIADEKAFITVKGKSNINGTSRYEWEKEIPVKDAQEMLHLCEKTVIEKNRFLVKSARHIFEIDEFMGANKGLVIAEVELQNENEHFESPPWLGLEVTGRVAYYNSNLSKHPFSNWEK